MRRALQPVERFLMSQLPPFSRPGTVRAASAAIESHDSSLPILAEKWPSSPSIAPFALGKHASGRVCITPQSVFSCGVKVWVLFRVRVRLRLRVRAHVRFKVQELRLGVKGLGTGLGFC